MKDESHICTNVDMEPLYAALGRAGVSELPELQVVEEVEGEGDLVAFERPDGRPVYYVRNTPEAVEELLSAIAAAPSANGAPLPVVGHGLSGEEVDAWTRTAREVARILGVGCPQIVFFSSGEYGSGEDEDGWWASAAEGIVFLRAIHLPSYQELVEMLVSLGHALRSEWQRAFRPDMLEMHISPDADRMGCEEQLGEVDAEAYGRKLAGMILSIDLLTGDDDYARELRKRAGEIEIDPEAVERAGIDRIIATLAR